MNKRSKKDSVYLIALITTILLSVTFRCIALILDFKPSEYHFENKLLITIASVTVTSGALFLLSWVFTAERNKKLIASFSTPETYIPTGAICTSLAIFVAFGIKFPQGSAAQYKGEYFGSLDVFKVSLFLGALALAHFALTALVTERSSNARAWFGISAVLFFATYASFLYFDKTLPLNAPNKVVDEMAFLFAALFFLYETRISLGREVWNLYITFGFIAALLNAYSSIPSLITYFVNGSVISNNIYENVVSFSVFVFIFARIALATKLSEDKESEIVTLIREYSLERSNETGAENENTFNMYVEIMKPDEKETDNTQNDELTIENIVFTASDVKINADEDLVELMNELTDSKNQEYTEEKNADASDEEIIEKAEENAAEAEKTAYEEQDAVFESETEEKSISDEEADDSDASDSPDV